MARDQRLNPRDCVLYFITDRSAFAGDEPARRRRLLEKIAEAAGAGVDYIQLREKDLPTRELESLASAAVRVIREASRPTPASCPPTTALLINSRLDIALAVGADGVHLRSDDIAPQTVREVWKKAETTLKARPERAQQDARPGPKGCPSPGDFRWVGDQSPARPLIGISCHSPAEVAQAAVHGASFAVFAPVFEKKDRPDRDPTGLAQLRQARSADIPVLALGGVTLSNARSCLDAGASGIAGIRLFQQNSIAEVVNALRA